MTYEKAFADAKKAILKSATNIGGDFAIQFNIVGEGEGYFYVEVKNGAINIEPYAYNDRDAIFASDAATIIKLAKGAVTAKTASETGKLYVENDGSMISAFDSLLTATVAAPEKKTVAVKKEAALKTAKTTKVKAAPKAEVKPAAKTEAKPVAAKTEVKPATAGAKAASKKTKK